jgi:hypothetical protein
MGMIFPLLALSILVIGALGVTWLITQGRPRVLIPPTDRETERLREAVQDLQLEMDTVRGELAEVQERLDFTERLLTRGTDSDSAQ